MREWKFRKFSVNGTAGFRPALVKKEAARFEAPKIERGFGDHRRPQRRHVETLLNPRQRHVRRVTPLFPGDAQRSRGCFHIGRQLSQPRSVDAAPKNPPPIRIEERAQFAKMHGYRMVFNSSSRTSGHTPMNLTVMCNLAAVLH